MKLVIIALGLVVLVALIFACVIFFRYPMALFNWQNRHALKSAGFVEKSVSSPVGNQTIWEKGTGPVVVLLHGAGDRGRIDVLINNAGITRDAQLAKWKDGALAASMTDEQWDAVIGVNLKGVFNCTRAVVPHMIEGGGGVILSASSVVGLYGNFGQTNYVATKAGVIGMTRTWARELGRHKIRVNAVAPGFIGTEMVRAMPPKIVEGMVGHTPLGRLGDPADIANAYAWLASDQASFVHGTVISVDGGLVMGT